MSGIGTVSLESYGSEGEERGPAFILKKKAGAEKSVVFNTPVLKNQRVTDLS